jgi:uncharacterized protein (TIGR03067 family)
LQPLLDQELSRLPEKYRTAIVLCELEGKSIKAAARQLGCPDGTLASWLSRGRCLLAKRLARHGFAVSAGALAIALAPCATAAPIPVVSSTIKAVAVIASGQTLAGAVSGEVAALTAGVLKTMLLAKLKAMTAALVMSVGCIGAVGLIYQSQATEPQAGDKPAQAGRWAVGAQQPPKQMPVSTVLGPKAFRDGDVIEITDVQATSPKLEQGDSVTVRGRFRLASHDRADLCLYLTHTEGDGKEEVDPSQTCQVMRGKGDFSLKATIRHRGVLHLTFYDQAGKPFGGVYFGTAAQMKQIEKWSLDYYLAAKPPEEKYQARHDIEGVWQGTKAARAGGFGGDFNSVWEIKDGTILSTLKDSKTESKYRVAPDKSPKEIDLTPGAGEAAGKTLKGIYKIDNDTLVIAYIAASVPDLEKRARPTEFDLSKTRHLVILTFKRKQP